MERSSRADLAQCLNAFQMGQMFFGAEFPSKSGDFHVVTDKFLAHCGGTVYDFVHIDNKYLDLSLFLFY